ncbi:hypothetical protein HID58_062941 [Brassica napus]|uniref:Uncharacterized protein n=1 Tax=Brassica napus TaxID=3708 RepID=A0ABQ7XWJ8_BRANA|nr:hypothetical protein HID58_088545 [Brassica napus]KAH0886845.1 hypothetical protein HID58_062941 [Brassica napus]
MKPMVKTKFTRNGKEVMIFGAMRNFDYGSDEAVQESKKGGERDASVSLPSLERSRIRKSVEGISMLASTEVSKASKTRRGTSYGSPASSPEKTTRRGTSYGSPASSPVKATRRGSTLSPRVSKKQKVNVAPSGDDREEWPETEMLASTVAKKTRRGTSSGGSPVSPRQSKKQKGLHFGESQAQSSEAQTSQNQSSQAQASPWEVPQSSEGQSSQAEASQTASWGRWFSSTTTALLRDTTNSHRIHRRILTTRTHHAILEEGEMRIEILKDEIEENRELDS